MMLSWRTYRNDRAGYAVSYPAAWRVTESAAGGVSFSPRRGGGSISVIVRPVTADGPQISDIPDGHCQAIRNANGLAGMRCFNTFSFTWYTVYFGTSATYTISATRQDMGNVYTHLVASFRLLGR